jgi:rare lipoprotein A
LILLDNNWEEKALNSEKFKILVCFTLIIFCVEISNCARRKYLDSPTKEITDKEKDGIIYLDNEEQQPQQAKPSETSQVVKVEYGKASYYADKFQGKPTASGELYDRNKLTAAHRTLPFGTFCRVTNTANKKTATVRINDRGPHVRGRIIDLSYHAMQLLDGLRAGEIDVMVEVLR